MRITLAGFIFYWFCTALIIIVVYFSGVRSGSCVPGPAQAIYAEQGMTGIDELLEDRHSAMLKWIEARPSCGPQGNDLTAHTEVRANVHHCINMQRLVAREKGEETVGHDGKHLEDFIVRTHARLVIHGG